MQGRKEAEANDTTMASRGRIEDKRDGGNNGIGDKHDKGKDSDLRGEYDQGE